MIRLPKLAWIAVALAAAHVVWLAIWPPAPWNEFVSQRFEFLAGALACYACWDAYRRSHLFAKSFWQFSSISFGLWCVGSILSAAHDLHPQGTLDPPLWLVLLTFLSAAPMFIAVMTGGGEEERTVRWDMVLDVAQLLILVIAIHLMLVVLPSLALGTDRSASNRLILLACWRGALAVALTVRAIFSRSQSIRNLIAPVAGAMSLFAVGASVGNYIHRFYTWPRVQWFELAWTIPYVMVAIAAMVWREPVAVRRDDKPTAAIAPVFIIYLPALAIPILLLMMYSNILFEQIVVGLGAMIISIICFTLRVLVAQRRLQRTVEQLRSSEGRYRSLFEHNMAAVYRSTLDGRLLDCNQAFCDMFGYTRDEILSTSTAVLYPGGREEREALLAKIREQGSQRSVEAIYRRKDGSQIHTLGHRAISHDENGHEILEGTLIDMTQRRSLESQLQQSQRMESLGMLAGGVAHDFNNLLTVINGYSAMQLESVPANTPVHHYATEIKSAAERAAALTRQLLAFSRQQVMEERTVNLNSLVRDFEKFLRRLIGEDIEVRSSLHQGLGTVRVDAGQMEQVLMNLVVNARDAMPTGGAITIETSNIDLDPATLERPLPVAPGPYVRLSVTDTGTGIAEQVLPHIFEPFFTTKALGKGTGLGLATTYGIVQQSRGYIDVQSKPGAGARFDVYLPRLAKAASSTGPEKPTQAARGAEGILLIEDNQPLRTMAKTLLESYGYSVFTLEDPSQLDSFCEIHSGRIDLLLTDVVLPRMSGTEVAKRVSAIIPRVKVLYISGYPTHALLDRSLLDATGAYLQKPFPPALLAAKVREVLDQRVAGQA
jgi:PAS domain S-box-containing protein